MIEFRYHIVSLIAVFLALAVGIVLGAGPLKEAIGDQLSGQVERLREEKTELRSELDTATGTINERDAFIDEAASSLLGGLLDGRRVVIVTIDQPGDDVVNGVRARLVQSGAAVTGQVDVEQAWTDPTQRAFRESLAGSLVSSLDPLPDDSAGLDVVLGEALAQGLTRAQADSPDALAEPAGLMLDLLREANLVGVRNAVTTPADDIVVVLGDEPELDPADADARVAQHTVLKALTEACFRRSLGLVVASGAPDPNGFTQAIRDDRDLERSVATVESVQTDSAQVSVPLALAARLTGVVGHYGFEDRNTAVVPPRVVLDPIVRVPEEPATPTDGAAEPGADPSGDPSQSAG